MKMRSRTLVLLRRSSNPPTLSEDELEALQRGHLAFLVSMREAGHMSEAGPFSEQEDQGLRGLCLYATPIEQTRELVRGDPMVKAGWLRAEVFTWWTPDPGPG
ncbi:MAG TPA: hypothetical protein VI541_04215, partial [Actinomycetota bacterium]|nr:hypothetical protein [Actinomycetota bacterium]